MMSVNRVKFWTFWSYTMDKITSGRSFWLFDFKVDVKAVSIFHKTSIEGFMYFSERAEERIKLLSIHRREKV